MTTGTRRDFRAGLQFDIYKVSFMATDVEAVAPDASIGALLETSVDGAQREPSAESNSSVVVASDYRQSSRYTEQTPSVTQSVCSGTSHFELAFQLEKDALRFKMFSSIMCFTAYLYSIASSSMFFSSLYPVTDEAAGSSPVDAFLMTSHVFAIDTTSAVFVTSGFFAAYTFANVPKHDRLDMCKMFAIYVLIDVWLVGLMTLVFGSIFHLIHHSFQPRDVALTVIESVFCLRALDIEQDRGHWHSLNPSAWPILCLFWATLLTPLTLAGNERLRLCHAGAGLLIPWVNASAPILIISLFALVHDNTNIFYINTAHVGYRILEFNFGICLHSSMTAFPACFWKLAVVVGSLWVYVLAFFVALWWAQLGTPVQQYAGTCIRMYNFSPCIKTHHGFLMRGCLLGATLVCRVVTSSEDTMAKITACFAPAHAHVLTSSMAAVLLTWPVCYVVHLLLEANFGLQLVGENAALLTLVVPNIAFALALLWDTSWKARVFLLVESFVDSAVCTHGA
jgi:hypothetical protein